MLSDRFENNLGASTEAVETWESKQETHRLAMLGPDADCAEQFAAGVEQLR
jgi:hypothetical protein